MIITGAWQKRGNLYRLGFVGIMAGGLVFILAFCTPSWAHYTNGHNEQHMGLWQTCVDDLSLCSVSVSSDNPGWLKAVRAIECISMFFAVAACVVGVYCNCIVKMSNSPDFFNKNMETSAIISVVFGTFGLIIFATQAGRYHSDMTGKISWSFVLACVADALLGLGAFTMLVSRRLQLMALDNYFAQRHFGDSFRSDAQFSDHTNPCADIGAIDTSLAVGPPAYDTVVDSAQPPSYSQVVSDDANHHRNVESEEQRT